ncbi:MAG: hypothetical protein GKR89_11090 [Candidatus Latescibacteria bacterium]|nr:hypothetical protein [Candidatus Latescibacterota bacterium]
MRVRPALTCMLLVLLGQAGAWAQSPSRGQSLAALPPVRAMAPRFGLEDVDPEVHKWYEPRHLAESYMRPWYATDTHYARTLYRRYVDQLLEGEQRYDTFGNPLGRGWLVYTWKQEQVMRNGSFISKGPTGSGQNSAGQRNAYREFFQNLVIASDGDGRGSFRLMLGDRIFTSFTPLTLYKPNFNGLRLDYTSDRYATSLLLSRPSNPDGGARNNSTHFTAGHFSLQVGPWAKVGFSYVNAHNTQTQTDLSFGNALRGALTTAQEQPLEKLWVRLRDDSPEDGQGGATLYQHHIVLVDTAGRHWRGIDIGFQPRIEGGRQRQGALVADGLETILLEYDLLNLDREFIESSAVQRAFVELVVANDYRIEMASNLQNSGDRADPETVFLTRRRAAGNGGDESNGRLLRLDYGLPTGNELLGFNWDLVHWRGLSLQGEAVLNRRYSKYPGADKAHHHLVVDRAGAAYARLAYEHYPWDFFAEAFSMDDGYSTNYWLSQSNGQIHFAAPLPELYEFVDDDDDHNALPEWERPFQLSSRQVAWPGYDENRDFLYDHNQNDNLIPDYEEPFLRFHSDRPEFLFGIDMNHNGTIDRFENDLLPDYPYKRDHRGLNTYIRAHLGPDLRLLLGRQRIRLISGAGRTHAVYAMATWNFDLPLAGRLRLFDFGALVQDTIRDHLQQWAQPIGGIGRMQDVPDPLPGRDTWKNTLYLDLDQQPGEGLRLRHRFKWDLLHQRHSKAALRLREGRKTAGFIGLINKAEWTVPVGLGLLKPRFKSEFRRDRPFSTRQSTAASLEETFILLWIQPLMAEQTNVNYYPRYGKQRFNTQLQVGVELTRFWMLAGRRPEIDQDFGGRALLAQLTNRVAYTGYLLVSRLGVQWTQRRFERDRTQRATTLFMTIHAGLK